MKTLRELHREHQPLVSPLAHDALSARLIERAGFKTFNIGGSAMLAARYALPDLGLAGFAEMLAGIRDIVEASTLPCLVDADDGYGDVKSVVRTIQGYETAGVSGALLEDQSREAKQPGAASARSVVPLEIMEQKLKAAMCSAQFRFCHHWPHGCLWRRRPRRRNRARRAIPGPGCRRNFRSRAEDAGRLCPGRQSVQRDLELRRDLRGGSDAVADAGRALRYGIFPGCLSEHPNRTRGKSHGARLASPLSIGRRQRQRLQKLRAGNGAAKPGRGHRSTKVERAGKEISLAVMQPAVDDE